MRTTVSIDDDVLRVAKRRAADDGRSLRGLLRGADARGGIVPDAHLAAVAIEHGAAVATRDRGFARFRGLRWLDPLSDQVGP